MSTAPTESQISLRDVAGTLVLVGAVKSGAAPLDGWLRLALDPARVAVIEPAPSPEIKALAGRGLTLNPAVNMVHEPTAVVIAVKPQNAAEAVPWLAPIVGGA